MRFDVRSFFVLLAIAALLISAPSASLVSAQQKPTPKPACPTTTMTCPDTGYTNDKLLFTANIKGGDPNVKPTFNWTVSAGTIESGQGTSTIDVSTKGLSDNQSVTATVEVGGFSRDCGYGQVIASCTSSVMKKPESRKFDEYGVLTTKEENERLDKFIIELQMEPLSQGYIIAYGGRASRPGDAQKIADKIVEYLVVKRRLDHNRIVTVDGGYREGRTIELWLVPSRAQLPKPTPTVRR
jgi:hypothetical protein